MILRQGNVAGPVPGLSHGVSITNSGPNQRLRDPCCVRGRPQALHRRSRIGVRFLASAPTGHFRPSRARHEEPLDGIASADLPGWVASQVCLKAPCFATPDATSQRGANSRASQTTGSGRPTTMLLKSECCGLMRTLPSLRATTEGTTSTAVLRSRIQASPKALDTCSSARSQRAGRLLSSCRSTATVCATAISTATWVRGTRPMPAWARHSSIAPA